MRCAALATGIVDHARGVPIDPQLVASIDDHVADCETCASLLRRERELSAALRSVASCSRVPVPAASIEAALLAAFDEARVRPRPRVRGSIGGFMAAAALVALAVFMTSNRPKPSPLLHARVLPAIVMPGAVAQRTIGRVDAADAPTPTPASARGAAPPFVTWPGATDLPPFESGQLVRVELPTSIARSLGLVNSVDLGGVIPADLLIGQDGFARGVRLAP